MTQNRNEAEFTDEQAEILDPENEDSDKFENTKLNKTTEDDLPEKEHAPEQESLENAIVDLKAKVDENWDKAVRAMSDLENFRRRSERDLIKARKFAIEGFVKSLMPVLDSLEQAASVDLGDSEHLKEGLELTLKLFRDTFTKNNVEILDPSGEMFDPELHEAMSTQDDSNVEPGTILNVFQKGYQLSGRVIRPARVVVSKKPNP
ncbi:MAG: nucleotide exchange factor GrpE [Legionellales bacterium]|nr:nucleotide exchange factor GrpE [Legionellales bacterium]